MPGKPRAQSPAVIAKAEKLKVDLTEVRASGEGGLITGDDVFRTAVARQIGLKATATVPEILAGVDAVLALNKRREAAAEAHAEEVRARQQVAPPAPPAPSALASRVSGRGPAFALNPRVDHIRAEASAGRANAPAVAAPTLFASGDLPSFTASGISPEHLLEAPWEARHAMAAAATTAQAFAILADCQQNGNSSLEYADHPGNAAYAERVNQWYQDSITDEQIEASFANDPLGAQVVAYEARVAAEHQA